MANLNRSRKRRYTRHFLREQCKRTGETYNRQKLEAQLKKQPTPGHAPQRGGVSTTVDFFGIPRRLSHGN